eukprot:COSAG04_NODE_21627_length_370_cov_1.136531_1_plen_115_part_10
MTDMPHESGRLKPHRRNVNSEALQVTEQLLVPATTLEVPMAFLRETIRFRRQAVSKQHEALKRAASGAGRPDNGLQLQQVQIWLAYWGRALPWYTACLDFYREQDKAAKPPRPLP